MLDAAQTAECSIDHDGQPPTQSLTFLHAVIKSRKDERLYLLIHVTTPQCHWNQRKGLNI